MAKYTATVQYTQWYEFQFESRTRKGARSRAIEIARETDLDTVKEIDSEMKIIGVM